MSPDEYIKYSSTDGHTRWVAGPQQLTSTNTSSDTTGQVRCDMDLDGYGDTDGQITLVAQVYSVDEHVKWHGWLGQVCGPGA